MPDLVIIEYTQSIAYEQDGAPHEHLSISVRFTYEAFSSGWVRDNFGGRGGPTDFMVLTAIANHARPLRGQDLDLLVNLGVATPADEGRLYARITDVGLADELGCGRDTIKNAAQRLADKELIRICDLPDDFRDSKGQFSGTKAFLISGIPSTYVSKSILPGNGSGDHRAVLSSTVTGVGPRAVLSGTEDNVEIHRAGLSTTAASPKTDRAGLAVTVDPAHRAGSSGTNKDHEKEKEEEEEEIIFLLLNRFAARKNDPAYQPSARERKQVQQLLDEGYSPQQLAETIDHVFDARSPDAEPVRSFGFVLSYIHRRLHPAGKPSTETRLAEVTLPAGDPSAGMAAPGVPPAVDAVCGPQSVIDPMAPVFALLEAATVRGVEGVEDVVYNLPGIRLGLQYLSEMSEPFSPREIHGAVLAAVSRSVSPDRLVGYTQAVLENARRDARERERLQQHLSALRQPGLDQVNTIPQDDAVSSLDAQPPVPSAGPGVEALAMWQSALGELELQMTRAAFNTWIKPVELLAWGAQEGSNGTGGTRVVLGVPNSYIKDWLENRLHRPIQRTLSGIAGRPVEIEFEILDPVADQNPTVLDIR